MTTPADPASGTSARTSSKSGRKAVSPPPGVPAATGSRSAAKAGAPARPRTPPDVGGQLTKTSR
ncbi:MAG: hypothetical protein ACC662_08085, partial [Planctomycetota bacterium]